jgi:hypothetical protein
MSSIFPFRVHIYKTKTFRKLLNKLRFSTSSGISLKDKDGQAESVTATLASGHVFGPSTQQEILVPPPIVCLLSYSINKCGLTSVSLKAPVRAKFNHLLRKLGKLVPLPVRAKFNYLLSKLGLQVPPPVVCLLFLFYRPLWTDFCFPLASSSCLPQNHQMLSRFFSLISVLTL